MKQDDQLSIIDEKRGRAELVTVIFPPSSPSTHFPFISPCVLINDGSFSPNWFARGRLADKKCPRGKTNGVYRCSGTGHPEAHKLVVFRGCPEGCEEKESRTHQES